MYIIINAATKLKLQYLQKNLKKAKKNRAAGPYLCCKLFFMYCAARAAASLSLAPLAK